MIENEDEGKNFIKKNLIAYSSLYGCTEEIALKIKEELEKSSLRTEIVKLNDKDQFNSLINQDLSQFSSILLGSSIVAGNFNKKINKILAKLESISLDHKKFGFFVSCLKASNPDKIIEAKNEYINSNLKEYNLKFSIVDAFGGKLDLSPDSSLNFLVKFIIKKKMLKENPNSKKIEPKIYDYRDWQQIEKFTSTWLNIIRNG